MPKTQFRDIIKKMPILFRELQKAPLAERADVNKCFSFKGGIYALYEKGRPLYVGRTKRRIAQRVLIHGRECSRHNAASFAFLLAREKAKKKDVDLSKTREQLEKDRKFKVIFSEQKERVRNMKVKAVEITDPETQAIFEIYASKQLSTRYNDFDTH